MTKKTRHSVINFELKGFDEVISMLSILPTKMQQDVLIPTLSESAHRIKEYAQQFCLTMVKQRSNRLYKSYKYTPSTVDKNNQIKAVVYSTLFYAGFVEFGTSKSMAFPILRTAADFEFNTLSENIKKEIEKVIAKEVVKCQQ